MNSREWFDEIRRICERLGTYKAEFVPVIDTLADILSERDSALEQYRAEGSQPLVEKTSDRGAVNMVKNPLLTTWEELNRDALAYFRDLGMTPAGLKKLNADVVQRPVASLEQLLAGLNDAS